MRVEDPAWLREQARRCRWLAANSTDPDTVNTLRLLAREYERKAAAAPCSPKPGGEPLQ
ncbi:MAG TPA: hypothetical protein VGC46_10105 [Allosphingosinicella sp.]